MPRIDPHQLLKTLGILLSPSGGIKSSEEVDRLVKLMGKFSRKLVSKCIYVQILKQTPDELMLKFLDEGGWTLLNTWFDDAIKGHNWPLVKEMLELFLETPMTSNLLKNNASEAQAPKLINQLRQELSLDSEIRNLASQIYKNWVGIVSESTSNNSDSLSLLQTLASEVSESLKKESSTILSSRKVPTVQKPKSGVIDIKIAPPKIPTLKIKEVKKPIEEPKPEKKRKSSTSDESKDSRSRKKFRPDHRDEVNPEEKQRIKDMARKLKEEAAKKDIKKLPKIPKKSSSSSKDPSKSFEEMLGGLDSKPKTVKTPMVKNKTAALLEGMKTEKSKSSSSRSHSSSHKSSSKDHHRKSSSSSSKDSSSSNKESSNKKLSLNIPENKSDKKSDSPKTKQSYSESSSFMDALFSNMGVPVARKKKRRTSESKDESKSATPPKQSKKETEKPENSPKSESPAADDSSASFSFYKDTLVEQPKVESEEKTAPEEEKVEEKVEENLAFEEPNEAMPREVKGILVYHRGRGKRDKKITWRSEADLVEVQYFEVDENERVNVNKLKFENLRELESKMEKAAVNSKSSMNEGEDQVLINWFKPVRIKVTNREPFEPGSGSKEKEIQANREKNILQVIYFNKAMTPANPTEADNIEINSVKSSQPAFIPLEDREADENSEYHYSEKTWPEPKENQVSQQASLESQFSLPPALSTLLNNIHKGGLESIIPNVNPQTLSKEEQDTLAAQTAAMKQLGILPAPTEISQPPPSTIFNGPPPSFPPPPNGFFPPNRHQVPPPPFGGFHNNRNGHGNGRGWNNGGGYRSNGPPPRGGGNFYRENRWDDRKIGTRPCKFYTGKGSCRDGDSCRFIHEDPAKS